jgi:hypothetical protein
MTALIGVPDRQLLAMSIDASTGCASVCDSTQLR